MKERWKREPRRHYVNWDGLSKWEKNYTSRIRRMDQRTNVIPRETEDWQNGIAAPR